MHWIPALVVALAVYLVAALLVRVAVSLLTMPLVGVQSLTHSRLSLASLRLVVGGAAGAGGLAAAAWLVGPLGGGPVLPLVAAVVALVAYLHVHGGWPFRGTPQFANDMVSLLGEEVGVLVLAAWWLAGRAS